MAMQETLKSIRTYFGLVGAISTLMYGATLSECLNTGNMVGALLCGVGIIIALSYLAMAVLLPTLIVTAPIVPMLVVCANAGFMAVIVGILLAFGDPAKSGAEIVRPVISFAISIYLLFNIRRLSKVG